LRDLIIQSLVGETSAGKPAYSKGWVCRCKDCDWAVAGRFNFIERTACHGCKRPKAQAQNPPRGNSTVASTGPVPGDSTKSEKVEKRRLARSKKAAARDEGERSQQQGKEEPPKKVAAA
jgi:hypothetical protein